MAVKTNGIASGLGIEKAPRPLYLPRPCLVVGRRALNDAETLYTMRFPDGCALGHAPGQFVTLSVFGVGEAPFSVCSSPTRGASFELAIRKAGAVTSALHELPAGSVVGIRGPFGRGFDMDLLGGHDLAVIAGGIGLAPLRSVIEYVIDRRQAYGTLAIVYGARSPSDLMRFDDRVQWAMLPDVDFRVTVDRPEEGWEGDVGPVTTLIPALRVRRHRAFALVVGPPAMYRPVVRVLTETGLPEGRILLSLERTMRCGVGKCGHCAIGDRLCCTDGPVFSYTEIKDCAEALG